MSSILHDIPVPAYIIDMSQQKIVEANSNFYEFLKIEDDNTVQVTEEDFFLSDDTHISDEITIHDHNRCSEGEHTHWITSEGDIRHVELSRAEPEKLGSEFCVIMAKDITMEITNEQQNKEIEEVLSQLQYHETIQKITSGIVHDFNNILTIIDSYTKVILAETDDSYVYHDEITGINDALLRASELSKRILEYSKRKEEVYEELDINEIINLIYPLIDQLVPDTIDIKLSLGNNLPCIKADNTILERVILNLVSNAKDAMPNGGEIEISTRRKYIINPEFTSQYEQYVLLTIADTGTGIEDTDMEKILKPYFTTKSRGTGLGLATVVSNIRDIGGYLTISSQSEMGTVISIYIPAAEIPKDSEGKIDQTETDVI